MANSKNRRAERRQTAPATPRPRARVEASATSSAVSYTPWILAATLMAATVLVYVPAIRGGFIWDDNLHITNNQTLRLADGLWRIWFQPGAIPQYYPLVHSAWWLEYRLWGLAPAGYHVVN